MFKLNHWDNPRATIANRYEHDDASYFTHGAMVAAEVIGRLHIAREKAKGMRLVDYGCGTGRIARVLCAHFGHVIAYDPNETCIAKAKVECGVPISNITYTDELPSTSPPIHGAVSVNVMEHLDEARQRIMMQNLFNLVVPGGPILLWYNIYNNRAVLEEFFGVQAWGMEDDVLKAEDPTYAINVRVFVRPQ